MFSFSVVGLDAARVVLARELYECDAGVRGSGADAAGIVIEAHAWCRSHTGVGAAFACGNFPLMLEVECVKMRDLGELAVRNKILPRR
eukprot:2126037-Rhodomonas_salina.2